MPQGEPHSFSIRRAPDAFVMQRLERDVVWLQERGLWSRKLFCRALDRMKDNGLSIRELTLFVFDYGEPEWIDASLFDGMVAGKND